METVDEIIARRDAEVIVCHICKRKEDEVEVESGWLIVELPGKTIITCNDCANKEEDEGRFDHYGATGSPVAGEN